ncbi:MAG: sigma-70 family RNA polymerase sigma factor [Phycisphaerae bacterium]|nr:sigma-70 family RNA polymerase sigma factor [Phycisphaerae bacterium]
MQKIKNPVVAQLLMGTSFVPKNQQLKQLAAAEDLYRIVESGREYPYEFICFKITGYRPKHQPGRQTILGAELLRDLPIYILRASARLKLSAGGQREKIYSINTLAEKFNVSARTIERWRKKGLLARKYIFAGNTLQTGFRESVVNEFASANPQLVEKASKFSTISPAVKMQILEMAQKLNSQETSSRTATIKKVAAHFKRAKETIRLIIIDAEKNQKKQIFKNPGVLLGSRETVAVYNLYESGSPVNQIAAKFNKSTSSIYRVINRRRIRKLLSAHIEYIESPEFILPDAEQKILSLPVPVRRIPKGILDKTKNKTEANWQEFVDTIQKIPMLNRQQEAELFRRYNFLKYIAAETIHHLSLTAPCAKAAQRAEQYLNQAERIKNLIIEANLKLVVRVAGRHTAGANLADLISEGNIALIRAVEKFDYVRGFRFSTYAVWVIARQFARFLPAEAARTERSFLHGRSAVEKTQQDRLAGIELIESTRRSLEQIMEDNLTEREQYVIRYHFGLTGTMVKKKFKTLKQIGDELKLSKERVRQIELIALSKLRQTLSPEEFELLTG